MARYQKQRTIHIAYDEHAVRDAFIEVLGFAPLTKTVKTMCAKRVAVSQTEGVANNPPADCADCLAERKRQQEGKE